MQLGYDKHASSIDELVCKYPDLLYSYEMAEKVRSLYHRLSNPWTFSINVTSSIHYLLHKLAQIGKD